VTDFSDDSGIQTQGLAKSDTTKNLRCHLFISYKLVYGSTIWIHDPSSLLVTHSSNSSQGGIVAMVSHSQLSLLGPAWLFSWDLLVFGSHLGFPTLSLQAVFS
jgi:hypothetical protein